MLREVLAMLPPMVGLLQAGKLSPEISVMGAMAQYGEASLVMRVVCFGVEIFCAVRIWVLVMVLVF
jgi:hypothetical protein